MATRKTSGWQARPTDRRATLPGNWKTLRRQCFERDGWRCVAIRSDTGRRCISPARECDHINDRDDHRLSNLRSLCVWHHNLHTAQQAADARKRKNPQMRKHPGVL